jgi:hypothetical protein
MQLRNLHLCGRKPMACVPEIGGLPPAAFADDRKQCKTVRRTLIN